MKKSILAVLATAALVGCSGVSDVTVISGTVVPEGISEVNIVVPEFEIDTLVPVNDGKFKFELPADPTVLGSIQAASYGADFVLDGTALKVTLDIESEVSSKAGQKSVQNRLNDFIQKNTEIQQNFATSLETISADTTLTEEQRAEAMQQGYDNAIAEYVKFNEDSFAANTDNILSIFALNNLMGALEDDEAESLIATLDEKLLEHPFVKGITEGLTVRKETGEGQMFKDFTIENSNGKTVSLSDYVGKGNYVLVDFWASWCGPCKREIPTIKDVYKKYGPKGLTVLSVAVWDDPQASLDTAKAYGVNWNRIINAQRIPTDIYGIEGIPHIILFGPDGTILKRDLRGEAIEEEVAKYL